MSARAWWVPIIWGLLLAVAAAGARLWMSSLTPPLLLGAASAGSLLTGIGIYLWERGRAPFDDRDTARPNPVASPPTVLAAIAAAVMSTGAFGGLWVLLIGVGLLALALVCVIAELLLERRARRSARAVRSAR
jgi:hypothetical protein